MTLLQRAVRHSLIGLGVQAVLAVLFAWLARVSPASLAAQACWIISAGLAVWLHLCITYGLLAREQRLTSHDPSAEECVRTSSKKALHITRRVARVYHRVVLSLLELVTGTTIATGLWLFLRAGRTTSLSTIERPLQIVSILAPALLLVIVYQVYLGSLTRRKGLHLLRMGRSIVFAAAIVLASTLIDAILIHYNISAFAPLAAWVIQLLSIVLIAEILFSIVSRIFSPQKQNDLPRPGFDFFVLEAMLEPRTTGDVYRAMLHGLFGFDVSRTAFGRAARNLLLPGATASGLLILAATCIVIVEPNEEAALLRLGRLHHTSLKPGLHVKLPWPVSTIRRYDVCRVRTAFIGSHRPLDGESIVYKAGVPILWTNAHGIMNDDLIICASPVAVSDTIASRVGSAKAPSVSLAAADIRIQYVIDDVNAFSRSYADPGAMVERVAETEATRFMYRYDIDALFCEARFPIADSLRYTVQNACDESGLGVRVIHAAITAVHPPVDVSASFEETVVAFQERETTIEQARQKAIQEQVETAGSRAVFQRIASFVDSSENGRRVVEGAAMEILSDAEGAVSQLMAEATAYRFSRENREKGRAERFAGQYHAYCASPKNYRYDQYLDRLANGLAGKRKVVLMGNTKSAAVMINLGDGAADIPMPPEMEFTE